MKVINCKAAAEMLGKRESFVRDRCQNRTPEALRIPHHRIPGSRQVDFFKEEIQAWIDMGFPELTSEAWQEWQKRSGSVFYRGRPDHGVPG